MLHNKTIENLLDIKEIYLEPEVRKHKRGLEVLEKYPDANLIEVSSHWKIPEVHGNQDSIEDWTRIKRNVIILGIKKSLSARPIHEAPML